MLNIQKLTLQLGETTRQYDFNIQQGNIALVQGPSGCGKTSLLLAIAGFKPIINGDILWQDKSIMTLPAESRPIALLFQQHNFFEHISIQKNIDLACTIDQDRLNQHAKDLEIDKHLYKKPTELSGGQRKRAGLLKTMLRQEPIILLDEPFSQLDTRSHALSIDWLMNIAKQNKKTVILVSHYASDRDRVEQVIDLAMIENAINMH